MASFQPWIGLRFLEAVAAADNDPAIGIAHETQRSGLADTMLVDGLFGEIDHFESKCQVVVHGVVDAGIELLPVLCPDGETERAAARIS